jgi:hypothetical protein
VSATSVAAAAVRGADAAAAARALAERAHRGEIEPNGRPAVDHLRRVVAGVPPAARRVAWLHDALERTTVTGYELRAAGLGPAEMEALALLTRTPVDDDDAFVRHVGLIALATGPAGDLARAVKLADVSDRMRFPRDPAATWRPPYARAMALLTGVRPLDAWRRARSGRGGAAEGR